MPFFDPSMRFSRSRPMRTPSDPLEDLSNSSLFLPFPSIYIRKLREASTATAPNVEDDHDFHSEPSDDAADRRYSDVSIEPDQHRSVSHIQPPVSAPNPFRRTYTRAPLPKQTLPTIYGNSPFSAPSRKPNLTFQHSEYSSPVTLTPVSSQPVSFSRTYNSPQPYKPHVANHFTPISPFPVHPPLPPLEPQRKKRSSLWNFLSGKRLSRRHRNMAEQIRIPTQTDAKPSRNTDSRPDSTRSYRLRRSSHIHSRSSHRSAHRSTHQSTHRNTHRNTPRNTHRNTHRSSHRNTFSQPVVMGDSKMQKPNAFYRKIVSVRSRSTTFMSPSSVGELQHASNRNHELESATFSRVLQMSKERSNSYSEAGRELHKSCRFRVRSVVAGEGSSVSSVSDGDDEAVIHSIEGVTYFSRRQPRSRQHR